MPPTEPLRRLIVTLGGHAPDSGGVPSVSDADLKTALAQLSWNPFIRGTRQFVQRVLASIARGPTSHRR